MSTRRKGARDWWALPLALGAAGLIALSMERWSAAAEGAASPAPAEGQALSEAQAFKEEFARAAGILEYHHVVYDRIGAERWEREVRPTLLPRLLRRMIEDTGIVIPTDRQILDWARDHPGSVRAVLDGYLEPERPR